MSLLFARIGRDKYGLSSLFKYLVNIIISYRDVGTILLPGVDIVSVGLEYLFLLQVLIECFPIIFDKITCRGVSAFSTFYVVWGVYSLAFGAGVVLFSIL